ncbi:MAG TPA: phosphate ABC transporter ATP-binding protein [Candidatus Binatia bacterium]|nr:phosphate ABC transporter ATP-binding protein [Candidatus Binatia bacterium]
MIRDVAGAGAPVIVTRGLRLSYGNVEALRGIDLDITRGRITALIGPSGCGKSTLLRCFNRINERYDNVKTTGEVVISGRNIYDPEVDLIELRKQVGMVFQRPNPMPIAVRDNVLYGYRLHSPRRQRSAALEQEQVESALRSVRLWDDLKDRLGEKATRLQLEQQQKLCIARLLPLKPSIILMDEPCSALDPNATAAVEDLMRALAGAFTIVVVTHNMAQARRVSDECVFMLLGEIVEHRRTEDLFIAPQDKRTADYIEGRFG